MSKQDSKQIDDQEKRRVDVERRQAKLLYSGMITLATIVLQAFISAGLPDVASFISVLAFALVLPIMGACIFVLNDPKLDRNKVSHFFATLMTWTPPIGCLFIFIGLVAALWHLSWIMGVVSLISGLVAAVILTYTLDSHHQIQEPLPSEEPISLSSATQPTDA